MDQITAALPSSVTVTEGRGGLTALTVDTARCRAEVYLHGAHVTAWQPAGQSPVLWMSEASAFAADQPIRGGIPVCAPWFGTGRDGDKAPAHGWFRVSPWQLTGAEDNDGTVRLTLHLDGAAAGHPGIEADYVVGFGDELTLELTVTTAEDLVLEEAFHTYLAVGDIEQVTVEGLDGCSYVDKAPGGSPDNTQSGDVTFTGETDRVYAHTGSARVVDPANGRAITLAKAGSGATVVWNPWTAKAAAMPDFGDDEWPGMVCLEAVNALAGAVELAAGGQHTLQATYSVTAL
ncbi:glucose-6-phosphate 1-epimerase [Raineyella antarctica]|uniref:Putative glucose-6-phosphate 1-epimerase n=1 Tax=Raineyella antarctica TaxID=1577474 RepID=A0A1G6GDP3_9ACTN|nr:D-hexose-6-phosphate mutarotase [Raineyella antarctica]SDB80029.1 glucose-6-phosphate 1-epimerase [Raineyella antarctica]